MNIFQVTAVQFNDDPSQVISAGIDNDLKIWDTRKNSVLTEMPGHTDTVTGMKLSPDGAHVLTNAMDNTVRMWVSWGKPVVSRTFIHDVLIPGCEAVLHGGEVCQDVLWSLS